MPAKIALTDDQVREAFAQTEGLIGAAAQLLGISVRTLSRRLASNPDLRPRPAVDPVWERALQGDAALRTGSDSSMAGDAPFTRYVNIMDWAEDEIEVEPALLTPEETAELAMRLRASQVERVTPLVRRRKTRERRSRSARPR